MTDAELAALVASAVTPGWRLSVERFDRHRFVRVQAAVDPADTYNPSSTTGALGEHFVVPELWDAEQVTRRLFATIQFLTDHELRETFTVAGVRPFDPHRPVSVTGEQHEWFVERESAVRGF